MRTRNDNNLFYLLDYAKFIFYSSKILAFIVIELCGNGCSVDPRRWNQRSPVVQLKSPLRPNMAGTCIQVVLSLKPYGNNEKKIIQIKYHRSVTNCRSLPCEICVRLALLSDKITRRLLLFHPILDNTCTIVPSAIFCFQIPTKQIKWNEKNCHINRFQGSSC